MFGEPAPEYSNIYQAIRQSTLFIAIGTSGNVIDIVSIAKEFKHSILIDPKRQLIESAFNQDNYIDDYFEHFIQKKAGEAMDEMMKIVVEHMRD